MDRFHDFEAICADVGTAIDEALAKHNLEVFDALAVCAVVEAMASPFKLHHLRGTRLTREVGRFGQKAYNASCLARQVEQIKSPQSLVVNSMMDAIVGAIAKEGAIADSELARETAEFIRCRTVRTRGTSFMLLTGSQEDGSNDQGRPRHSAQAQGAAPCGEDR